MSLERIEGTRLTVWLDQTPILDDVSVRLSRGEMIGIVGPNGAGKSSLLKTLLGLIPKKEGEVTLDGIPAEKISRKEKAKKIAYLPQGQPFYWPLSAERIVALGRVPYLSPWQALSRQDDEAVWQAMKDTDTFHLKGRSIDHLAGGERALVFLARVLAGNPEMIFADEPVDQLDPSHELQVMELLKNWVSRGHGAAVVLHNLTLAARFCDRLYLLNRGKIVTQGKPEEVLAPDFLKQTYGIQARYGEGDDFFVLPWKRLK